jgi:hypothetical protein
MDHYHDVSWPGAGHESPNKKNIKMPGKHEEFAEAVPSGEEEFDELSMSSDVSEDDSQESEAEELVGRKSLLSGHSSAVQVQKKTGDAGRYKRRLLLLSSRGIPARQRHLINNLAALLPHAKKVFYN